MGLNVDLGPNMGQNGVQKGPFYAFRGQKSLFGVLMDSQKPENWAHSGLAPM